jgi:hypothetical protein
MRARAKPTTNMPKAAAETSQLTLDAASSDQVEVSGAAFVPIGLKAHGSTSSCVFAVIQSAIAKTVPAIGPTTAPAALC